MRSLQANFIDDPPSPSGAPSLRKHWGSRFVEADAAVADLDEFEVGVREGFVARPTSLKAYDFRRPPQNA